MQHPESSRPRRSTDPATLASVLVTTMHHLRAGLRRLQLLGRARCFVATHGMVTR
jgi:hypothetical protein